MNIANSSRPTIADAAVHTEQAVRDWLATQINKTRVPAMAYH